MDRVKIEYVKDTINKISDMIDQLNDITQDCDYMLYEFDKDLQRHNYDNTYMFFKDNLKTAVEYYECNKLKELYNAYCEWCKLHEVDALAEPEFKKGLEITAPQFTPNKPQNKMLSVNFVLSQLSGYISGCIDKGCTIPQTQERVNKYCLDHYPNASIDLQFCFIEFARCFQNFYFIKKDFEEVYKNER